MASATLQTTVCPEDSMSISFAEGADAAELQIKQLCKRLLPGWSTLNDTDLEITRISGGISNLLVKVAPRLALGLGAVAVKVFGDKTELLIDRDAEKHLILQLNTAGFGAKVVGLFGNGRIEEFLSSKTLSPEDIASQRYMPHVARRLRAFHQLRIFGGPPEPTLWRTIFGWLDMACTLSFGHDPIKQAAYDAMDFEALRQELLQLQAACMRADSPVVMCHNDLLAGNVLIMLDAQGHELLPDSSSDVSEDQEAAASAAGGAHSPMQFIDFEYSAYSYRGFDFGNHFNEYAGFDCDYSRFPQPEAQMAFFRAYLGAGELRRQAQALLQQQQQGGQPQTAEQLQAAEVGVLWRMVAEASVYALASHAYWGVWTFIQARYSPIDFDYLGYGQLRFTEMRRRREEFFKLLDTLGL